MNRCYMLALALETSLKIGLLYRCVQHGDTPVRLQALGSQITNDFAEHATTLASLATQRPRLEQVKRESRRFHVTFV